MLKISILHAPQSVNLKLEGELSGPWTAELERNWNAIRDGGLAKSIRVDLSDVIYIDQKGKHLLSEMLQQGADLQGRPPMTRFILMEIKRNARIAAETEGKHGNVL